MTFTVTMYSAVLGSASLVSAVVAVSGLHRRTVPGGRAFTAMMWAVVYWTLMSGLGCAALELSAKILFTKLSYIGGLFVAPLFLVFAVQYSGAAVIRSPLVVALMAVIPAVSVALALTNEMHHLVWSGHVPGVVAGGAVVLSAYGPWYWVSIPYLAALDLLGAAALVRHLFRAGRVYRFQLVTLLAALAAPWVGEVISDVPSAPFPGLDTPAVGCAIGGVILILGLLRYRLLDVAPVARRLLVERMADGLVVLDGKDRLVDVNPAACRVLDIDPTALGQPVERASPVLHRLVAEAAGREDFLTEATSASDPHRQFELRVAAVHNRDGKAAGRMIVLHEVTTRRQAEAERERLIGELRTALADIKTLRGLLPICMSCRKIRDDSGYWQTLEQYVEEHTEAQFSHALCEDCLRRLYPEYAPNRPDDHS